MFSSGFVECVQYVDREIWRLAGLRDEYLARDGAGVWSSQPKGRFFEVGRFSGWENAVKYLQTELQKRNLPRKVDISGRYDEQTAKAVHEELLKRNALPLFPWYFTNPYLIPSQLMVRNGFKDDNGIRYVDETVWRALGLDLLRFVEDGKTMAVKTKQEETYEKILKRLAPSGKEPEFINPNKSEFISAEDTIPDPDIEKIQNAAIIKAKEFLDEIINGDMWQYMLTRRYENKLGDEEMWFIWNSFLAFIKPAVAPLINAAVSIPENFHFLIEYGQYGVLPFAGNVFMDAFSPSPGVGEFVDQFVPHEAAAEGKELALLRLEKIKNSEYSYYIEHMGGLRDKLCELIGLRVKWLEMNKLLYNSSNIETELYNAYIRSYMIGVKAMNEKREMDLEIENLLK